MLTLDEDELYAGAKERAAVLVKRAGRCRVLETHGSDPVAGSPRSSQRSCAQNR